MRTYKQGSLLRIAMSAADVSLFADSWPCSGLEYGDRVVFVFESNGDLVDYQAFTRGEIDESAMLAMSEDCWRHYEERKTAPTSTRSDPV